jgi:hypothetical protein
LKVNTKATMTVYGVSSTTTTVLLRTSTQCPVASSRTVLVLQQWWVSTRRSFSWDRRCVTWTASRRGLVGRSPSPSRCGLDGRARFHYCFSSPATAAAERKSARQPVTFVYFVPRRRLDQRHFHTGRGPLVGSGLSSAAAAANATASRSGTGTGGTWWAGGTV